MRNYCDLRFWLRYSVSLFVAYAKESYRSGPSPANFNELLFTSAVSRNSAGHGLYEYIPFSAGSSATCITTVSRHLCCLFVHQKREPWTHPLALTPVVRTELACLTLAHPGRHAAFPQQATGAFLSKGNKTCKQRIYQHISHTPGEGEAKRIHYSGSPASSLVNPYYSGMIQK